MLRKSIRAAIGALAIAAFTTLGMGQANAQTMTERLTTSAPENSGHLVWGFGGGVNSNMAYGNYNPTGSVGMGQNGTDFRPEGHLLLEVPITQDLAFAPRISYHNMGTKLDRASAQDVSSSQTVAVGYQTLGVDALMKYNVGGTGAYIIGGAGVSEAVKRSYAVGTESNGNANMSGKEMPNAPLILPTAEAGLGFDIPVRSNMWISPEVTYRKPLMNLAQGTSDGDLDISTISSKVSMKFAIP